VTLQSVKTTYTERRLPDGEHVQEARTPGEAEGPPAGLRGRVPVADCKALPGRGARTQAVGRAVGEFGISTHSIQRWVRAYRLHNAAGLEPKRPVSRKSRVADEVRQQAVAVKAEHSEYGPRWISDFLKRFFLMRTSPATVHKTLAPWGLVKKDPVKAEKNPSKSRFFERARPNQLWQKDILTIRLGGHNAYLIGIIDDYSRYITSLGLYRSQTAEHMLETYRRGVADYGVLKEVLTDNGRQYTNWRGKSRFEQELEKDQVKHIRSRPYHPMTLGNIEQFWKSILGEFLQWAQFDSFEQAVGRTAFWVKYYNHKRRIRGSGDCIPRTASSRSPTS
jgi:transposase InsO family protein